MNTYYVDLHVHIGRSSKGVEIKKATSINLTLENITVEAQRKGINVIGLTDCISPYILEDIENLLANGILWEHNDGGLEYNQNQLLILGAEIETHEKPRCSSHSLCFFPTFKQIKEFSKAIAHYMKDIRKSATMSRLTGQELFDLVNAHKGIFIPAHIFTPHKSFYGNCCDSLLEIFNANSYKEIPAIELGLSADSMMANQLSELDDKSFLSNSDAHSLSKIGREYNVFEMEKPTYKEVLKALKNIEGRKIKTNYGLNPKLGKYHRSYCMDCDLVIDAKPPVTKCPVSNKHHVIVGVYDRHMLIKDREKPYTNNRPPYNYQIPLEFIPKVGPKTIAKLINKFGTEMNVLHKTSYEDLLNVVKNNIAHNIILGREGKLHIDVGGGGIYGKITSQS